MIEEEIASYLQAHGLGTEATDIFAGSAPPSPDELIVVTATAGQAPEYTHDNAGIAYEHPGLQIKVRSARNVLQAARVRAQKIYQALMLLQNQEIEGVYYVYVLPTQTPYLLRRDENQRAEFVFNCRTMKAPSPVTV